jgi:hypothetical protein
LAMSKPCALSPGAFDLVAVLLARECRAGEVEQRVDAALDSNDADHIELMTIACKQRIGKACYGLAKSARAFATPRKVQDQRWKLACLDARFDVTSAVQAARYEACLQILEMTPSESCRASSNAEKR